MLKAQVTTLENISRVVFHIGRTARHNNTFSDFIQVAAVDNTAGVRVEFWPTEPNTQFAVNTLVVCGYPPAYNFIIFAF